MDIIQTTGGVQITETTQGVISIIKFPLGQDEKAVSKAIHHLLVEGWDFKNLDKESISFKRVWEA